MTYNELKNTVYQNKLSELSDKVGLFWAFNPKQFKEGAEKNPTTGKYTSIGMGGYLPSKNVDQYIKGIKTLDKWFKQEVKNIKKQEAILYELNNYECFYTGDIQDAVEALAGIYTAEEIREVYKTHRRSNQE